MSKYSDNVRYCNNCDFYYSLQEGVEKNEEKGFCPKCNPSPASVLVKYSADGNIWNTLRLYEEDSIKLYRPTEVCFEVIKIEPEGIKEFIEEST